MTEAREVNEPTLIADGVVINEVYGEEQTRADGTVLPAGPGIGFQFTVDGQLVPNIVMMMTDREMDELARSVKRAIRMARRHRAVPPGPVATVYCPGCNLRLFGAVAQRGACTKCFPTLPGDES